MRNFTLPYGFKRRTYKGWHVNGYYEFMYGKKRYRHYCLEKNGKGYNAVVRGKKGKFRGKIVSDSAYYRRGLSPQKLARRVK